MPKPSNGPRQTPHQCSGELPNGDPCPNPVQPRRPSLSGEHFCSAPSCQRKKQREAYQRRTAAVRRKNERELLRFIAALGEGRTTCGVCGRLDAVQGYIHPDESMQRPCAGTGGLNYSFMAGTEQGPAQIVKTLYRSTAFL